MKLISRYSSMTSDISLHSSYPLSGFPISGCSVISCLFFVCTISGCSISGRFISGRFISGRFISGRSATGFLIFDLSFPIIKARLYKEYNSFDFGCKREHVKGPGLFRLVSVDSQII